MFWSVDILVIWIFSVIYLNLKSLLCAIEK